MKCRSLCDVERWAEARTHIALEQGIFIPDQHMRTPSSLDQIRVHRVNPVCPRLQVQSIPLDPLTLRSIRKAELTSKVSHVTLFSLGNIQSRTGCKVSRESDTTIAINSSKHLIIVAAYTCSYTNSWTRINAKSPFDSYGEAGRIMNIGVVCGVARYIPLYPWIGRSISEQPHFRCRA